VVREGVLKKKARKKKERRRKKAKYTRLAMERAGSASS
jgi:hypothetical protein